MYSRKFPKRYTGFTVIKDEDGVVEKPWKKYNGFEVDKEEATKVVELPAKNLKKDI